MSDDYRVLLADSILDEATFLSATFSGQHGPTAGQWQRVSIRPVLIRSQRQLQFTYFDGRQTIVKNYAGDAARDPLAAALDQPFRNFHVLTTGGTLQINLSKKGRPLISRGKPPAQTPQIDLSHDRAKQTLVSPDSDSAAALLRAVGILTEDGRIRQKMAPKYRQINDFLRILDDTGAVDALGDPVRAVDLGCGSAHLTFATYHYLTALRGLHVHLTGVDLRGDLLNRHVETAAALGYAGLDFETARIIDYATDTPPTLVIALHACNTATDEALARAIEWGSQVILAAPCCHHHLQEQLSAAPTPAPFVPVMRHGILHERMGDLLTDALRALILRICGYRTDIVEFVDSEHTPRNLMIRAVRTTQPGDARFSAEYAALRDFWGVTPYLETLLRDRRNTALG